MKLIELVRIMYRQKTKKRTFLKNYYQKHPQKNPQRNKIRAFFTQKDEFIQLHYAK